MKESEVAAKIVDTLDEVELALQRGHSIVAEGWLNLAGKWIYLLENVDLDYDPQPGDLEYEEADDVEGPVTLAAGNTSSGLTYHIEADLDPADDEDDDPDDIKRLGPIELL